MRRHGAIWHGQKLERRCNSWRKGSIPSKRGAGCPAMLPILTAAFMAAGTVKWFNATKGFGFIQPDAGGADVFVHISAVERAGMRDLNEGQKIAYEIVADKRTAEIFG